MSPKEPLYPPGYGWQYHLLQWLQSFHSATLDQAAVWLSWLGTEWFYILVFAIILWSVNKTVGYRIAYTFLFSMYINGWLKDATEIARPIGLPGIRSAFLSSAPGNSFPSGHTQGGTTFWLTAGLWLRNAWLWPLIVVVIAGIGLARFYLGLHWPLDILVGWGLGLVVGALGWVFGRWWTYRQYGVRLRLAFAIVLPVAGILMHTGRTSLEYACLLLGLGVGAVLEQHWWGLTMEPALWKRLCAAVVGCAGIIALYWLCRWATGVWTFGSTDPLMNLYLAIRDVAIGFWGSLGAPYVFRQCGLYKATVLRA